MQENSSVRHGPKEVYLLVQDLEAMIKATAFPPPIVPRTDPEFLSMFIRVKDYDLELALKSVQKYYRNIHRNISMVKGMCRTSVTDAIGCGANQILRRRCRGSKVWIFRIQFWKPSEIIYRYIQLASYFMAENLILDPQTQENGIIFVFDLKGIRFEHFRQLSVKEIRRMITTLQEGLPLRITEVHFMNPPPFFWTFLQVCLTFVKDKIRKRVHFHYKLDTFSLAIGEDILPDSLGGTLNSTDAFETYATEDILRKSTLFQEYCTHFKEDEDDI